MQNLRETKQQCCGYTGLINLGNTCYMNATLQCLANTTDLRDFFLDHQKFQKQINCTNPLGLKGAIAIAYAILMKQMWNGGSSSLAPSKIQTLIGEKYPHFKGFQQQDAQEFMGSLLSLLHEDLNRIEKRPVLEPLESDGWSDTKIAEESWRRFLSRDDSIIVDNFFGQFKSKLTCPVCNKVSIIFDACNSILLPISASLKSINSIILFQNSERPAIKFRTNVAKSGQYQDIIDQLGNHYELKSSDFRIYKSSKDGKLIENYSPSSIIDSTFFNYDLSGGDASGSGGYLVINEIINKKIMNDDRLIEIRVEQFVKHAKMPNSCNFCKTISSDEPLKRCAKCLNAAYCNSDCQTKDWNDHKMHCNTPEVKPIGIPFAVTIRKSEFTSVGSLKKIFINYSKNFIEVINTNESNSNIIIAESSLYSNFELTIKTQKSIQLKTLTDLLNLIKAEDNDEALNFFSIKLVWNNDEKLNIRISDKKLTNLKTVDVSNQQPSSNNLDQCLKLFSKAEKLTPENPWYCPKCKKHQEATKQIYLWKLPKYLIIILKRFQAHKQDTSKFPDWMQSKYNYLLQNHVSYEKINTLIEFPLYNLDMSNYIYDPLKNSQNNENIYDLHSVVNHLGDSLYSGHYTAFSRCHEPNDTLQNSFGWRVFDDSHVQNINEKDVITKDAYVLFYRRRETTTETSSLQTTDLHQNSKNEDEFYSCEEEEDEDGDDDDDENSNSNSSSSISFTNLNELD